MGLREFCIFLCLEVDDCVVFDFWVLADAYGVDISEIGEDLSDVSLGKVGGKVLDSDGGELDAVLRGGRRGR